FGALAASGNGIPCRQTGTHVKLLVCTSRVTTRISHVVGLAGSSMTRDIHDALVKTFFSQRRHAASLFAALVPESVARLTDWSTLDPCPASFVDAAFGSHHADLLFVARQRGSRVPVYFHLEHQSTPERMLPCRVHGYRHGIWAQYQRLHPRSQWLPAIF